MASRVWELRGCPSSLLRRRVTSRAPVTSWALDISQLVMSLRRITHQELETATSLIVTLLNWLTQTGLILALNGSIQSPGASDACWILSRYTTHVWKLSRLLVVYDLWKLFRFLLGKLGLCIRCETTTTCTYYNKDWMTENHVHCTCRQCKL